MRLFTLIMILTASILLIKGSMIVICAKFIIHFFKESPFNFGRESLRVIDKINVIWLRGHKFKSWKLHMSKIQDIHLTACFFYWFSSFGQLVIVFNWISYLLHIYETYYYYI